MPATDTEVNQVYDWMTKWIGDREERISRAAAEAVRLSKAPWQRYGGRGDEDALVYLDDAAENVETSVSVQLDQLLGDLIGALAEAGFQPEGGEA